MVERTAALISFVLLFVRTSCQHTSTTGVRVQSFLSSSFSDMETSTIQHQPIGGSKKDHAQVTTEHSWEHPTDHSREAVTNQLSNAAESTRTKWLAPKGDLPTSQRTDVYSDGSTVGATDLATSTGGASVGPTNTSTEVSGYQYIESTTGMFKQESTGVVHDSSVEYSTDISTKESNDKQSTVQTTGSPDVPSTEQQGDFSSVISTTSSLTTISSGKYITPTATQTSTELATTPVVDKSTQLINISSYTKQSTESVTAVSYTDQFSKPITDSSYTEQFTESITALSYSEQPTNVYTITLQPIEKSSVVGLTISTSPHNETAAANNDDSNDDWKIAVGVVIPLLVLIAVLVGVYMCYRKKYPVRMIIGREFGKFSNPNYLRRGHTPSLVREDADFYFSSNRTSTSVRSQEFNPVNNKMIYDNMGFVKDDNDDADEKERKFLESKSWLFKKASEESKTTGEEGTGATAESSFIANSTPNAVSRLDANRNITNTSADAAKTKHIVDDERKPVIKPRRKKMAPEPPGKRAPISQLNGQSNGQPATLDVTSEIILNTPKVMGSSLPRNFGLPGFDEHSKDSNGHEEDPRNLNINVQLVQQSALNQEVKDRSKSLNLDPGQLGGRPRSFSVDQPRSTRKMSLYEEIVEATRLRFLAAQKITSSISEEVSKVTAFLVGVDIRDRDASVTSSDLTSDDDTAHDDRTTGDNSARWKQSHPESKSTPSIVTNFDMPSQIPITQKTNFEDINPQKDSASNQYDVQKFGEGENTSALDNTDYDSVSRSSQLLSDNRHEEESNKGGNTFSSQSQGKVSNPDPTLVSSGPALKGISYQDDTDSAFPGAYNNRNIEHHQGGVPDRSTSSTSESSSSASDHEEVMQGPSNVATASELAIPVIQNADSHIVAEANGTTVDTIKILRPGQENLQEQEHDSGADSLNEVYYEVNISASERVRKIKPISPEMRYSSSSTESVLGSPDSSRGIPSDNEDEEAAAVDFSISHEMPNESIIDASNNEFIFSSPSRIKLPLSHLHRGVHVEDPTSPTHEDSVNLRTAVFQMQYSDSSSDSYDIVPRKASTLLSSERQNQNSGTVVEEGKQATKVTGVNDDHTDLSSKEQSGDFNFSNDGVAYKLLDYDEEDDDIDV